MKLQRVGINESGAMNKITLSVHKHIGSIIWHGGSVAPEGTLLCDGSAVSRTTYADLFAAIGTTFGTGDGSTTFNVPDLRNVWAVGAGTSAVGADVAEGLPDIQGRFNTLTGTRSWLIRTASGAFSKTNNTDTPGEGNSELQSVADTSRTNSVFFHASNSNPIYGASTHVTPASVALTPCIIYE